MVHVDTLVLPVYKVVFKHWISNWSMLQICPASSIGRSEIEGHY